MLGLASCASVIATMQDTYSAIVRRIEEKAVELKEATESICDKSISEDQQQSSSRPLSRHTSRVAPTGTIA